MADHRAPGALCRCGHPRQRHARCRCLDPDHGPTRCTEAGCSCQLFTLSAQGIELYAEVQADALEAAIDRCRQLLVRPDGTADPLAEGWLAATAEQLAGDRQRQAVQLLAQAVLIRHQRTASSSCACGELPLGVSHAAHVCEHLQAEGVLRA